MKRYLLAAAVCLAVSPVLANPQKPSVSAVPNQAQVEINQIQSESATAQSLDWSTDGYQEGPAFSLNLRSSAPGPVPFSGTAPPGSVILGTNAFYGQLQTGVFGSNNPGDQWSAFGSPGPLVTGIYGLRYNWEQDFATFSLTNVSPTRKDANIGFGSGLDTQLNFNFVNTALVPTTVATLFPAFGLQVRSAVREGIETSNSQVPIVGITNATATGPSPVAGTSTLGYIGLINRRIVDTASGTATNGRVLARTDVLTLQRDGTNGGLRIGYPVANGSPYVTCHGLTSTGLNLTKIITPVVEAQPVAGAVTANTIFSDAQGVVAVNCTFGNAFDLGNITTVNLQRRVGDFYYVGTLTSTFNQ